eukprot:1954105-Rhodomonas_salina.1
MILDIARHAMVFERASELDSCLEAILNDSDVRVPPSPFPPAFLVRGLRAVVLLPPFPVCGVAVQRIDGVW